MTIAHSSRSRGSPLSGNRKGKATRPLSRKAGGRGGDLLPGRRRCEPNVSEPDSASLHKAVVTTQPETAKSDASGEEMSVSIRWTIRGEWGGRVPRDRAGTWETRSSESTGREDDGRCAMVPSRRVRQKGRKRKCEGTAFGIVEWRARHRGMHNPASGSSRESDRPIVVLKRGNARGAKGPNFSRASVKERRPA